MIVLAETTPALLQVSLLAEFASRQPRPELKHVLRLAEDGMLSEQIVLKRLNVSERAAFNILSECASLGLIDQQGSLTPEGKAFLKDESGLAYVPEHGCFNVLLGRHPAFGQALLHIERTPEDIELADIADQLDVTLRPGDSTLGKAKEFKFWRYLTKNRRGGLKSAEQWSARLSVELASPDAKSTIGKIQWMRGAAAKDEDSLTLLTPAKDLWETVLRQIPEAIGTWKTKPQPHLAIPYQSAKPEEATHFLRTEIRIAGPHHLDSEDDHWSQFTLRDIPIGPANQAEARAWADALFFKAIQAERSYLNLAEATELHQLTSRRNPILADLAPAYKHSEALRHASQLEDRQVYWALQANNDLNDKRKAESSLRIEPHEHMSLQLFLAKVVGTSPANTHFFLYDRFALREPNWRNVPALLEACRGVADGAKLTILYQPRSRDEVADKGPDPKPSAPEIAHKNCYDLFTSADRPHDRYLFSVSGDVIKAWQLSNSPLAAKADHGDSVRADTPLEWPALMVFPVDCDKLEVGFQTFFKRA